MEMEEHSPSQVKPGPQWTSALRFHTSMHGRHMGSMGVRRAVHSGWWRSVKSTHVDMLHHWTNVLVIPLTHSPDLETGATSPKISPCDLQNI